VEGVGVNWCRIGEALIPQSGVKPNDTSDTSDTNDTVAITDTNDTVTITDTSDTSSA
jgi:hypothetical protein